MKLFSKRLFVFLLFMLEHPITVSEDLTGDEKCTEMFVDEMEQDEFELEENEDMDSDSSISDTSIDSTMTYVLSDSDEMSKESDESSSEVEEEEAITSKKSNKRKLA